MQEWPLSGKMRNVTFDRDWVDSVEKLGLEVARTV